MRRISFSSFRMLLLCFFFHYGIALEAGVRPKIVFEQLEYDLGTLRKSEKNVFVLMIPFTNKGNRKLKIKKLESSCECLTVHVGKKVYKKGERGCLVASLEIKELPKEEIYREISISTNGRDKENMISISAIIEE